MHLLFLLLSYLVQYEKITYYTWGSLKYLLLKGVVGIIGITVYKALT